MKRWIIFFLLWSIAFRVTGQEAETNASAQQLEALAEATETEPENDQLAQEYQYLLSRPADINRVRVEELENWQLLSDRQITAFIQYRELFGPIRSPYELQAIPFWDITTCRKIIPLIRYASPSDETKQIRKLVSKGQHQFLLRSSGTLERAEGYQSDSLGQKSYAGSRLRLFYRYTYQYKQQLWWGISGEKDAGERFGDFTGFHLFIKRPGFIKTVALGDYILNIGQGLVQWQGLAFGKSGEAVNVFRQGNILQPYRSGGEFNFQRGMALQFQYKKWELTPFVSKRTLTANLVEGAEGANGFTSIDESGYHRTDNELADRNSLTQIGSGAVLQYLSGRFRAGISWVFNSFSIPAKPQEKPYNQYAIRGSCWSNSGIHYSYTHQRIFLFGEAARCKGGIAILQGMVVSLHPSIDFSMVFRKIDPGYKTLYGSSFTESSTVSNETGWYAGIKISPAPGWQLQAYSDYFRFPWLRFRTDAPSMGREFALQASWVKRKKWNIYLRYRITQKPENLAGEFINEPMDKAQTNIRLHAERIINRKLVVAARFDKVIFSKTDNRQLGTAFYADGRYQFGKPALTICGRLQYFNTGGYESRIYAYERDLLYSFSIPSFYDKGFRYYCQLQGKPARFGKQRHYQLHWWTRWSQSRFAAGHTIGSGGEALKGNRKSEWKCQLMLTW